MIGRIRWQILIAVCTSLIIFALLGSFAISTAATTRPLEGRVYVEGVVGEPQQLNPLAQPVDASPAERDLAALLFAGLTRIDSTGRVAPALAERWTVSNDGRVYTFTIRADARWHDGAPVTADDVLYTVHGVQNAGFPGDPALAAIWRNVLVERVDPRTVRFELSAPFAPFPSVARLPLLPAHLLSSLRPDQWASSPFGRRPVGAGPFMLRALDAQQALLTPFAGYASPRPQVDQLLLRFYPTQDAALLGLGRREVQGVATTPLPGRRAPDPPQRTQHSVLPLGDYAILTFNLQQPPLNDPQFRKALVQAINRDLLITNVLGEQGQRVDTPILPGTWAGDPQARLPEFRRSAAQQVLGALGYRAPDGDRWLEREGQRLTLPLLIADAPEQVAVASEIARQLREIGIALEVRRVSADELQEQLAAHNFTLALHSWRDVGADPDVYALWHSSQADGKANYAGLSDPRIDELLTQGRATSSEAERTQIYRQFQQRWVELIPSLPLYQSVLSYDVDQAITLPASPPALITSRADRFSTLDRWQVPAR